MLPIKEKYIILVAPKGEEIAIIRKFGYKANKSSLALAITFPGADLQV